MVTTKQKKGRQGRPTKATLEKQKAFKKAVLKLLLLVVLGFAAIRLGSLGVFVYNLMRFFVGSLTYTVMLAIVLSILAGKWLKARDGLVGGFWVFFFRLTAGMACLLIYIFGIERSTTSAIASSSSKPT